MLGYNYRMLLPTRYLSVGGTYLGVVFIPYEQIPQRMHELPPPSEELLLVDDCPDAKRAEAWLRERGRAVRLVPPETLSPAEQNVRYRLWEPNHFLQEVLQGWANIPQPYTALDLGCGSGREAVYLADLGWQVVAVDRLPDALERGRDLQARYAPDSPPIQWVCAELEQSGWKPAECFRLITMFYFYSRPLLQRAWDWLLPEGALVLEAFTETHSKQAGRPTSPARFVRLGELPSCLPPSAHIQHYSEGIRHDGRHTARLWAIRF